MEERCKMLCVTRIKYYGSAELWNNLWMTYTEYTIGEDTDWTTPLNSYGQPIREKNILYVQHHVSGLAEDAAFLSDHIIDVVHKDKRADGLERLGLLLLEFRKYLIRDPADHLSCFNLIKVLKLVIDILNTETSGIKGDHLIINARDIHWYFE